MTKSTSIIFILGFSILFKLERLVSIVFMSNSLCHSRYWHQFSMSLQILASILYVTPDTGINSFQSVPVVIQFPFSSFD